jgi:hypothetical protein
MAQEPLLLAPPGQSTSWAKKPLHLCCTASRRDLRG